MVHLVDLQSAIVVFPGHTLFSKQSCFKHALNGKKQSVVAGKTYLS